ncbi:MAG: SET domain-containing protein [Burkholderiales bacterium]|nr:SET domain-containing protein [Burkholderiales bacterium]
MGSDGARAAAAAGGTPALGAAAVAVGRPRYQKYAVDVHASPIDGLGVFAAERVPAALKIGEIRGETISVTEARIRATRTERVMIVELSARKAIDFSKSSDPMRYTNHSCRPNAELVIANGRVEFFALRAIARGDEITVDYGETHHEGRLACRCGAAGCRGAL